MIPRYSDHAANERTFLAWVRTALAIIVFGCFLAKFDLFLRLVAHIPSPHLAGVSAHGPASILGVVLVAAGTGLLPASLWHYQAVRKAILAPDECAVGTNPLGIFLVCVLGLTGLCAFVMLLTT
ncbi:YidH family protein [Acetobacter fallax]|uniref:DUF202 domain-containing protein n=1 Tax=Acetobacter fallax TaxID=1737473 RepID=A0ABX0K7P9_9PROT|nr:DUF202 domain-containing protein [Acetobacter fallax]NHO32359.1 DUF202 domain-containing protein [Acetobacter fallax]NHO35973.1 DUF202 domain-containing protein [Acetobacter fallax]